jgi:16S rRNA (adenine1518-N6/adenine1519-N6)-dimethyltransferase
MIDLRARKSLGQNFLTDRNALERIVAKVDPQANDIIIEIGPGTGLLTRQLLRRPLSKLLAFELDKRAVPELRREFAAEEARFEVREQDFLEVDLPALSASESSCLRVVGNIPYYITSPILFKLIDERSAITDAMLLVQLEVAERLTATPSTKAYGIPTVLANFFGEVKLMFRIPAGAFRPVPKVDSAVIHVDFRRNYFVRTARQRPEGFDEEVFRMLVRGAFAMRRKTLRNNLKSLTTSDSVAKLDAGPLAPLLDLRAEALDISQFIDLTMALSVPS